MKKLNQLVWQIFTKGFGLTLQADAANFLVDKVTSFAMNEAQMKEFLNYMAQNYGKISKGMCRIVSVRVNLSFVDRTGMVSKVNIEIVYNQVFQSQDYLQAKGKVGDVRKYVRVINAQDTPKFEYDVHAKAFKR